MSSSRENATLSFVGRVVEAPPDCTAGTQPVAVEVEQVLGPPGALGDISGTVVLVHWAPPAAGPATASPGERFHFDVVGVAYGARIEVRALSIGPASASWRPAPDPVIAADVEEMDTIVVGRLDSVGSPTPGPRLTEHDPAWAPARITVDEVLKGPPARSLDVELPTSGDVLRPIDAQPRRGETAIFFLRAATAEDSLEEGTTTVVNVRPLDALTSVRDALARP